MGHDHLVMTIPTNDVAYATKKVVTPTNKVEQLAKASPSRKLVAPPSLVRRQRRISESTVKALEAWISIH